MPSAMIGVLGGEEGVVDSESPGELSPALAQPELVQINKIQGLSRILKKSCPVESPKPLFFIDTRRSQIEVYCR